MIEGTPGMVIGITLLFMLAGVFFLAVAHLVENW